MVWIVLGDNEARVCESYGSIQGKNSHGGEGKMEKDQNGNSDFTNLTTDKTDLLGHWTMHQSINMRFFAMIHDCFCYSRLLLAPPQSPQSLDDHTPDCQNVWNSSVGKKNIRIQISNLFSNFSQFWKRCHHCFPSITWGKGISCEDLFVLFTTHFTVKGKRDLFFRILL